MGDSSASMPLPQEEWDFQKHKSPVAYTGCPADQLLDCFEYEYSRTRATAKEKRSFQDDPYLKRFYRQFGDYFPKTPWLRIPAEHRKLWSDERRNLIFDVDAVQSISAETFTAEPTTANHVDFIEFGRELVHVGVTPIAIAWHKPRKEIEKAFKKWLDSEQYTETRKCQRSPQGKGIDAALRSSLKKLGAHRLLESLRHQPMYGPYKDSGIVDLILQRLRQMRGVPYKHNKSWMSAVQGAATILKYWNDPVGGIFENAPALESDLRTTRGLNTPFVSPKHSRELVISRMGLYGARSLLALTPENAGERIIWAHRYPPLTQEWSRYVSASAVVPKGN